MAAEELNLSNDIDAELKPHVAILANDLIRYAAFAELLIKNGFPCTTHTELSTGSPRAGTVFFVSYNLKSADSVQIAKLVERQQKMICIVFAEDEGIQTATQLSSAKQTQTLQYPYTEKNFLMAMQTIVKKRKAQYEKDLRKKQHDERQKAKQKAKEPEAAPTDLKFAREPSAQEATGGVLFQSGPEHLIDDRAKVFKGEVRGFETLVQKFTTSQPFMIVQEGAVAKPSSERAPAEVKTGARKQQSEVVLALVADAASTTDVRTLSAGTESPVAVTENLASEPMTLAAPTVESEYPPSLVWTIVVMCLLGSAICFYCVYQILFT